LRIKIRREVLCVVTDTTKEQGREVKDVFFV